MSSVVTRELITASSTDSTADIVDVAGIRTFAGSSPDRCASISIMGIGFTTDYTRINRLNSCRLANRPVPLQRLRGALSYSIREGSCHTKNAAWRGGSRIVVRAAPTEASIPASSFGLLRACRLNCDVVMLNELEETSESPEGSRVPPSPNG